MIDIGISHPEKLYFPSASITKEEVVEYYFRISELMLPHLKGRPLMLHRFPEGTHRAGFYQKQAPHYFPDYIERARVPHSDGVKEYAMANNPKSLVYLANHGTIAFHAWLSTVFELRRPDQMTFDLDPEEDDFGAVRFGAERLKELLEGLGATPFVKTTGSRGLHITVPLQADEDFDEVRAFAKSVAQAMARKWPETFTVQHRKDRRSGRVLIDYWRNAYAQTQVAPYSVRALPDAPVAAPISWDEALSDGFEPDSITIRDVEDLLSRADPWEALSRNKTTVAELRERLK